MLRYLSVLACSGFILGGMVLAQPARAQFQRPTQIQPLTVPQKFKFVGQKFNVDIAGEDSGEQTVVLGPDNGKVDGKPVALAGIWIDETGDEPCAIRVTFRELNLSSVNVYPFSFNLDRRCSINAMWTSFGGYFWENEFAGTYAVETKASAPSNRWSMRSLKVCSNKKKNDRGKLVKGIQVDFVNRDPEDGLTPIPGLVAAKQPNCKGDWLARDTSVCPDNSVAMGLRVVTQEVGNKQSITGLGLVCRSVELVPALTPVSLP